MNGRREFLKGCGRICFAAAGFSIMNSCSPVKYVSASQTGKIITVPVSAFGEIQKRAHRNIVVRTNETQPPILVNRLKDGGYAGILLECSHQGAELTVNGDILTCPAHGSEFDNQGNVTQGPAEQNLFSYKVTSDSENTYIHLT